MCLPICIVSNIIAAVFTNLLSLTVADLSNNMITYLGPSWYVGLNSLQVLYLNGNVITSLFWNATVRRREMLSVGSRKIIVESLVNLRTLDLGSNKITHLPQLAFETLTKLEVLNLQVCGWWFAFCCSVLCAYIAAIVEADCRLVVHCFCNISKYV